MDEARWKLMQSLFEQALPLAAAAREDFIAQHCAGDKPLADELRALLHSGDTEDDLVPPLLARAAGRWLESDQRAWIGRRLGSWRIVEHLADGGMGAVFLAERADGQYEQQVAIKLLNPALVSPRAHARLEAERQILARLTHPLVARLLDGGRTEEGAPYLVMEFVDGVSIDRWCEQHGLDTASRLRLFVQLCQAVDFAHRNLVVHRDLKPSNILVDHSGKPRLLDFGIARLLDADGVTGSGERPLTPSHASPEQITGGAITTATDVYALGVLLYELLVGRLPHADASDAGDGSTQHPAALARAIVETEPTAPSSAITQGSSSRLEQARLRGGTLSAQRLARELSGDLDNIVLTALRKEPTRRYASVQELADDVERFLAHRPVKARTDTVAYRMTKFLRRHRIAVPVSALALVAALAGAGGFTWRIARERDRALAAERSARLTADYTAAILMGTGAGEGADRQVPVLELLTTSAERLGHELKDEPEVANRIRVSLGAALHSWGAYEQAQAELLTALRGFQDLHAEPQAQTAQALSLLGTVAHDRGELEISLDWTRQAEAMWRTVGTPAEHGSALSDLALALNGLRRRSEAEPVFRAALTELRQAHRASGGDHADVAWTLNNLAWCLHAMGRLDEAAPLYEQALAMQQRLNLPDVETFQTVHNLAGLQYDRGEFDSAERLWRDELAAVTRVYGEAGHAAVARAHNTLGVLLLQRGQRVEALQHIQAAVQGNLALLGEKHRWTATTLQSLGVALLDLGRLDEAGAALARSLAARRAVLPEGHSDFVGSWLAQARLAQRRNQLALAESELRRAIALIDALPSPDRVQRDRVEWLLGSVVARQGRRDEGRAIAERAVAERQRTMPLTHPRRLAAEAGIALPPFVAIPTAQALAAARQTLQILRERLGPEAPAVREIEQLLAG